MKVIPLWSLVSEQERKKEEREDERICGKNLLRHEQNDVKFAFKSCVCTISTLKTINASERDVHIVSQLLLLQMASSVSQLVSCLKFVTAKSLN